MRIPTSVPLGFLLLLSSLGLSSCASYNVVLATGSFHQELEQHALQVVWRPGSAKFQVLKQEKGSGLLAPVITADETAAASVIATKIMADLTTNVAKNVAHQLAGYVGSANSVNYELVIEMGRNVVRTDGSTDTTVIAYLHVPSGKEVLWSRSVQIITPVFEGSDAMSVKFSNAIVELMKAGGLVR